MSFKRFQNVALRTRAQFSQMLSRPNQPVPVFLNVLGRAANLCDGNGHIFRRHHFNGVPRADRQFVGVRFLARDVHAHLAANAPFQVDLAPLLRALHDAAVDLLQLDAIDRADFEARLATGAVVGVDDRQLLRNFFAWSFFGHGEVES